MPKMDLTKSPCIDVCKLTPDGLCAGCFRTREEIRAWKIMDDARKADVNRRVLPLMEPAAGKALKKARKRDKKIRKLEKRLDELRRKKAAFVAAG